MTQANLLFRPLRNADIPTVAPLLQQAHLRATDILPGGHAASGLDSEEHCPFVLEDMERGAVVGFIMLRPAASRLQPLHSFRRGAQAHASYDGNTYAMKQTLTLSTDLVDCALLGMPLLLPGAPPGSDLRLVEGALAHAMEFSHRFPPALITRLPGRRRSDGGAPFWDGLGRHFVRAKHVPRLDGSGVPMQDYGIAELMPRWPIYVDLLPAELRAATGQLASTAEPVHRLLLQHGFMATEHVDVIDGGPWLARRLRA